MSKCKYGVVAGKCAVTCKRKNKKAARNVEGKCSPVDLQVIEYDLANEELSDDEIRQRLNDAQIEGVPLSAESQQAAFKKIKSIQGEHRADPNIQAKQTRILRLKARLDAMEKALRQRQRDAAKSTSNLPWGYDEDDEYNNLEPKSPHDVPQKAELSDPRNATRSSSASDPFTIRPRNATRSSSASDPFTLRPRKSRSSSSDPFTLRPRNATRSSAISDTYLEKGYAVPDYKKPKADGESSEQHFSFGPSPPKQKTEKKCDPPKMWHTRKNKKVCAAKCEEGQPVQWRKNDKGKWTPVCTPAAPAIKPSDQSQIDPSIKKYEYLKIDDKVVYKQHKKGKKGVEQMHGTILGFKKEQINKLFYLYEELPDHDAPNYKDRLAAMTPPEDELARAEWRQTRVNYLKKYNNVKGPESLSIYEFRQTVPVDQRHEIGEEFTIADEKEPRTAFLVSITPVDVVYALFANKDTKKWVKGADLEPEIDEEEMEIGLESWVNLKSDKGYGIGKVIEISPDYLTATVEFSEDTKEVNMSDLEINDDYYAKLFIFDAYANDMTRIDVQQGSPSIVGLAAMKKKWGLFLKKIGKPLSTDELATISVPDLKQKAKDEYFILAQYIKGQDTSAMSITCALKIIQTLNGMPPLTQKIQVPNKQDAPKIALLELKRLKSGQKQHSFAPAAQAPAAQAPAASAVQGPDVPAASAVQGPDVPAKSAVQGPDVLAVQALDVPAASAVPAPAVPTAPPKKILKRVAPILMAPA